MKAANALSAIAALSLIWQPIHSAALAAQAPSAGGPVAGPVTGPVTGPVAAAASGPASAAADAPQIDPATGLYLPSDKDERGLWMQVAEAEREIKVSPLVMHDAKLNNYVRAVFCRTVGQENCRGVRIYLIRSPEFNASMAPNGMLTIFSGLLVRTRNEAQLAAVLGHEYTHYRDRHSIKLFHDVKNSTSAAAWLSMFIGVIGALMILPSIFAHSREMEHDADMGGVSFMANAGYDTRQAAGIWEQLRAEMDATAAERKTKSRKDKNGGMFATHPPSAERVTYLTEAAKQRPGTPGAAGNEAYAAVMRAYWPELIDDQLKRNDFGAADYLLNALEKEQAADWLSYAHGELYRRRAGVGDLEKAVVYYGQGIAEGGTVPELWRGRGLALLKLGKPAEGKTDLGEYLKRAPEASDKSMIAMMAGE